MPGKILHLLLVLPMVLFFLGAVGQARGEGMADAEKQYAFGEKLQEEGDYYRAIGEYKRYIFLYPQGPRIEKALFRIAESYYRAEKWQEAIDGFKKFSAAYPESVLIPQVLYLQGLAEQQLKRFDDALLTFEGLSQIPTEYDRAVYQMALILVEKEDWEGARRLFARVPGESPLYDPAQRFSSGLGEFSHQPRKSPEIAGALAAVLPGAGHLYTERPRDALAAFLLNASFIWASLELFHHDNSVAGGIVAFFELGWYTGNIYSAVGSAHKYNERIRNDFLQNLKDRSSLTLYKGGEGAGYYVMYSMRY